jgi:hypothetical protein
MYSIKLALVGSVLLISPFVPTQTDLRLNTAAQIVSYDKPEGQTQPQIA